MFHVCFVLFFVRFCGGVCKHLLYRGNCFVFSCVFFFVFHSHELAVYNGKKCMAFTTSTHLNKSLSMKFNVIILHVSSIVTNFINIKPLK